MGLPLAVGVIGTDGDTIKTIAQRMNHIDGVCLIGVVYPHVTGIISQKDVTPVTKLVHIVVEDYRLAVPFGVPILEVFGQTNLHANRVDTGTCLIIIGTSPPKIGSLVAEQQGVTGNEVRLFGCRFLSYTIHNRSLSGSTTYEQECARSE